MEGSGRMPTRMLFRLFLDHVLLPVVLIPQGDVLTTELITCLPGGMPYDATHFPSGFSGPGIIGIHLVEYCLNYLPPGTCHTTPNTLPVLPPQATC